MAVIELRSIKREYRMESKRGSKDGAETISSTRTARC